MPNFCIKERYAKRHKLRVEHQRHIERDIILRKAEFEYIQRHLKIEASKHQANIDDNPYFDGPPQFDIQAELRILHQCPTLVCTGYIKEVYNSQGFAYVCLPARCIVLRTKQKLDVTSFVHWARDGYIEHSNFCDCVPKILDNDGVIFYCERYGTTRRYQELN